MAGYEDEKWPRRLDRGGSQGQESVQPLSGTPPEMNPTALQGRGGVTRWWPGASFRRGAERPTQECGSENGTWGVGGEQLVRREEPSSGDLPEAAGLAGWQPAGAWGYGRHPGGGRCRRRQACGSLCTRGSSCHGLRRKPGVCAVRRDSPAQPSVRHCTFQSSLRPRLSSASPCSKN